MNLTREQILTALTAYYEAGDLSFLNTVNNITWGYKQDLKKNGGRGASNFTTLGKYDDTQD